MANTPTQYATLKNAKGQAMFAIAILIVLAIGYFTGKKYGVGAGIGAGLGTILIGFVWFKRQSAFGA